MDDPNISTKTKTLGGGLNKVAKRFSGYVISGFRFRTCSREVNLRTQNSGIINTSVWGCELLWETCKYN